MGKEVSGMNVCQGIIVGLICIFYGLLVVFFFL